MLRQIGLLYQTEIFVWYRTDVCDENFDPNINMAIQKVSIAHDCRKYYIEATTHQSGVW